MNFELKRLYLALFIPVLSTLLMIAVFVVEQLPGMDFHQAGIFPRLPASLGGIFSIVFIHASPEHLFNNILSYLMLSSALFYVYRYTAVRVLLFSWFFSGLILWLIGRDSWHVGASGLIYALAFYLFFSGIFRWYAPLIALSLLVTLIYGNMVWHMLPWKIDDPVSWEGHLAGGITGLCLALIYRHFPPQKPVVFIDDEEEDDILLSDESTKNNSDNFMNSNDDLQESLSDFNDKQLH